MGSINGSMSRDEAFYFLRLGRALEQADMTTRIIDVGAGALLGDPLVRPQLGVHQLHRHVAEHPRHHLRAREVDRPHAPRPDRDQKLVAPHALRHLDDGRVALHATKPTRRG